MEPPDRDLLRRHHAFVPTDNPFQAHARLLQCIWREKRGLPIGENRGRPLGSRLAMPFAKESLANYLTDAICEVVRREVFDPGRSRGKLFGQPRIFNDLLSSQPLCFNLFGELQQNLTLATRALSSISGGRIAEVSEIEFEHSPGRGNSRYAGDRSAFDVFVEYRTRSGGRGFAGIEVKYHESLDVAASPHRERYDEIASGMGCFKREALASLRAKPLQQVWRDHLLAGCLLLDREHGYEDGFFAFLYPRDNDRCSAAVEKYGACLADARRFVPWTLEKIVGAVRSAGTESGSVSWRSGISRSILGSSTSRSSRYFRCSAARCRAPAACDESHRRC